MTRPPDTAEPTIPIPAPQPVADDRGGARWWLVALLLAAVVIAAVLVRRRRAREPLRLPAPHRSGVSRTPAPPPASGSVPVVPPPATLDIAFRPVRAGLNLLSAIVEGELTVTNRGDAALERVSIATALVNGDRAADDDIARFLAQPAGRAVVPPFPLAPGQARTVRIVAPLVRDAIRPLDAGGRAIFVPIVAFACRFVAGGGDQRATSAFVIGVERVDSLRLAPIRLDASPRMYDSVAARPHPIVGA